MGEDSQSNPLSLDELIGQESVKQRLTLIAKTFGNADSDAMPGHMVFDGPAGSGRLAFAQAFAQTIHAKCWILNPMSLAELGDNFALICTAIKPRTVVCFEDLERIKSSILIGLEDALRSGRVTISIGQGPSLRHHTMDLHPFTAILLTSGSNHIPEGIRNAITFKFNFQHYSVNEMDRICLRHAVRLGLTLTMDETENICNASSGIVGNLIKSLRNIHAFMTASNGSASVDHALEALGITRCSENHSNNCDLQQLSGIEFEQQIGRLLGSMGFHTEMTRTSGDGGIDIVAHLNQPIVGGRYLFQCKRFAVDNVVGAPYLRDFFGALKADPLAIKGIFVTTSSFTEQARQFAQQVGIELIDSAALSELLTKYQS